MQTAFPKQLCRLSQSFFTRIFSGDLATDIGTRWVKGDDAALKSNRPLDGSSIRHTDSRLRRHRLECRVPPPCTQHRNSRRAQHFILYHHIHNQIGETPTQATTILAAPNTARDSHTHPKPKCQHHCLQESLLMWASSLSRQLWTRNHNHCCATQTLSDNHKQRNNEPPHFWRPQYSILSCQQKA